MTAPGNTDRVDPLDGPPTRENRQPRVTGETARIAAALRPEDVPRLLEAAVRRVERLASQFTGWGLPWYAGPDDVEVLDDPAMFYEGDDDWKVFVQPTPVGADFPEPHEFHLDKHGALACIGGGYVADRLPPRFARYAAVMGPQITGALVASLRAAADSVGAGALPDGDAVLRHLVELAIEIVHREDPRDGDL